MLLANRTVAALIASQPGGPGRHTLELYVGDTNAKLQLPDNPATELVSVLDRPGDLTTVYTYVILDEPDGSLTVRISDPSRHIVHFVATGTCIETLTANFAEQDQHAVQEINKELKQAYFDANRGEFENELITGDSSSASARVGFLLHEDEIMGMPSTVFALGNLIASAADQPNYDPTRAWRPMHGCISHFA